MARRTPLREFQERLLARLEAIQDASAVTSRLGFRLGEQYWLVDLTSIDAVLPVPPLDAVPLTKPWYAGIANIRGTLYSVIDFAMFCGLPPTPVTRECRVLLIKPQLLIGSALLVSGIAGLRNLAQLRAEPGAGDPWIRAHHREEIDANDQRLWTEVDVAALVREREFLEVAN